MMKIMNDIDEKVNQLIEKLNGTVTDVFHNSFCPCGTPSATTYFYTDYGSFRAYGCGSCGPLLDPWSVYPTIQNYVESLGGIKVGNQKCIPITDDLSEKIHKDLLRMDCKSCGTNVAKETGGFTIFYDDIKPSHCLCRACGEEKAISSYEKSKILTTSMQLQAYFRRENCRYDQVNKDFEIVTEKSQIFWPFWFHSVRTRDDFWSVEVNGVEVSSASSAGRVLVQLERGDSRLTLITHDTCKENEKFGIQGIYGTVGNILEMIDDVVKDWDRLVQDVKKTDLWIC